MVGFSNFYRIRIGDYRVGIELLDLDTILFIAIAHRKDIYKTFP
jgi:mRNA interferase RelE/StbE